MSERRNSLNSVMVSEGRISECNERGFSDIENGTLPSTNLIGILRLSSDTSNERQKKAFLAIKLCLVIITIVICTPFILFDLIYAYTDKSCVDIYPNKLNINMKTYLLVCGYIGIADLIILICSTISLSSYDQTQNEIIIYIIVIYNLVVKLFLQIWTIIAAIIYWGTLYHTNDCSRTTYNYLFISITIKLVLLTYYLCNRNNYNKNTERG